MESKSICIGKVVLVSMLILWAFTPGNSQNFAWAMQLGGADDDIGASIANDAPGNVYCTGSFQGTADFDPGAGTFDLTSLGSADIFISKLNTSGDFVWVKQMGGADLDRGFSLAIDVTGNVFTAGAFSGTADFDPDANIFNLTSAGNEDVFISKLDGSGTLLWARRIGGAGNEEGLSITVDIFGNAYTTGSFSGTVDFDPGLGVFPLSSAGSNDIFIVKLDALGNFIWAKKLGGGLDNEGLSIKVDALGNIYTTGRSKGTADFDPGPGTFNLTSASNNDIFISKLDASGNFVWAKLLGGVGDDQGYSITVDNDGGTYITGWFHGTVDFDPGAGTVNLTSIGLEDVFILKLNALGNFVWAKQLGGINEEQCYSIAIDASRNVYTTGYFRESVDFDPGAGTFNLTSANTSSIFISKLDASGNFVWAKQLGGIGGSGGGNSIAVNGNGIVYTTGSFVGTGDFDPDIGTSFLISLGIEDIFVHRMDQCATIEPLQITCPNSVPALITNTNCQATIGDYMGLAISDGGCGGNVIVQTPPLNSIVNPGTVAIILTVSDNAGQTASCVFNVNINGTCH